MTAQLNSSNSSASMTITTPAATPAVQIRGPELSQDSDKRVTWDATGIDNEHMNKKKSKKCCQYHKPKRFNESDSESDDEGRARRGKHKHGDCGCSGDAGAADGPADS